MPQNEDFYDIKIHLALNRWTTKCTQWHEGTNLWKYLWKHCRDSQFMTHTKNHALHWTPLYANLDIIPPFEGDKVLGYENTYGFWENYPNRMV